MTAIDHVVVAVRDLDAAAERLAEHGLTALPGGRHPGAGTANRIVPLGDAYLELMAIVDAGEAATSLFGQLVARRLEHGEGLAAWCVRPDDLERAAAERGLEVVAASRVRPDGVELRWRLAGVAEAVADPAQPFLIAWDVPPDLHPSAAGPPQGEIVQVDAGAVVIRTARGEVRL